MQLLERYGVLTREAALGEGIVGGFAGVYPVLKALEERGNVRRGYFVAGLGAAQFALPGAVDRLRAAREPRRTDALGGEDGPPVSINPAANLLLDLAQWHAVRAQWPASLPVGLKLANDHEYGNGTCIFTRDGEAARYFTDHIQVGMVGVNVPLPVPVAYHSFGGWKRSLFGDMHAYGEEGVRFYTRQKSIMQRWPESTPKGAEFVMPTAK